MSSILELYRAGPSMRYALKQLIKFYYSNINLPVDIGGNTLLHYAFWHKDHDMAAFLLEWGANPYKINNARQMPISYL